MKLQWLMDEATAVDEAEEVTDDGGRSWRGRQTRLTTAADGV